DAHDGVRALTLISLLRLRGSRRRLAARRSSCPLLIPLALLAALAMLAVLTLPVLLALTVFALAVLALTILARVAAALLARREVGRRRLLVAADDHLGAVGEIGEAGRHHTIVLRQAACDHRVGLVLLRHRDRLGMRDIVGIDHIAERPDRSALDG